MLVVERVRDVETERDVLIDLVVGVEVDHAVGRHRAFEGAGGPLEVVGPAVVDAETEAITGVGASSELKVKVLTGMAAFNSPSLPS